ncbi:integral membrane transport protein [Salmonella enterica subsp. enterica]|nr:integral membrane transport protein [Salmonella enterica subsp. enterica]
MSITNIPAALSDMILGISANKLVILLVITVFLLIIGAFMDIGPAILIFTPILLPIMAKLGVDPVHFGIIMIYNLAIGTITPPVGSGLYVGASVGKVKVEEVIKPLLPFLRRDYRRSVINYLHSGDHTVLTPSTGHHVSA